MRKPFVLAIAALGIWIAVGLRYVDLTRDPVQTLPPAAQPVASGALETSRAPFQAPSLVSYGDPFAPLGGVEEGVPDPQPGLGGAPPQQPRRLAVRLQGVVGRAALLVLPGGETQLARQGDALQLPGGVEARVTRVGRAGVTLVYAGETVKLAVEDTP